MAVERNPFQVLPGGMDDSLSFDEGADLELEIEIEDGDLEGVSLSEDMASLSIVESDHYINIADYLDDDDLTEIGSMVCDQFEADKDSRSEWESTFERGLDLLGIKLQETTEPFEGACTAVSPLIIESAIKFQSKASIELFPPGGPVRTQIVGSADPEKEAQATRVQQFMNYQLTDQVTEYFDEFERMLFHLPLVGSAFKKIYYDPNMERPCSEFVPVDQFYVSYHAPDLRRADRYTHVIYRSPNELRKEISGGMYKDIELPQASPPDPSMLGQKIDSLMGLAPSQDYDQQYVLLEQHCYLDLPAPFNDEDGVAYPYIVTVEESSQQVLSIRRNFNKDDPRRERETYFAHYKFVPGFGFYGLGLVHLLGNLTMSATAALRSLVDAGQFANLPGGFKARGVRVVGGNDPISPGEFREVESTGMDLQKSIVPLPYKEPSQVLFQMLGFLTTAGQKFADTTDQIVADATNYGPVGTTMALLEAGAKFFSAVHKRLHHSQREEFRILARINYEFLPDAYPYQIPNVDSSIFKSDFDGRVDVIPVSDPNIPSAAHRLAMAQMVLQMASQAPPGMYDLRQVHLGILSASNIQNPERYMPPQPTPQPNDPITDIQVASQGQPIKAFPQQDHASHIAVKSAFIEDPTLGQNPMMQSVVPVLQANIREHMVLQYAQQLAGLVQMGSQQVENMGGEVDKQILGELTTQAAQQVLQANKAGVNTIDDLERASLELEKGNLNLKQEELRVEAAKDAAELAIKNREIGLKERELQFKAVQTLSNKEDKMQERQLRAVKEAGNLSYKRAADVRRTETTLAVEAIRAMLKEQELMMKQDESERKTTVELSKGGVASNFSAGDKLREVALRFGMPLPEVFALIEKQKEEDEYAAQADKFLQELDLPELIRSMGMEDAPIGAVSDSLLEMRENVKGDQEDKPRIAIRPSEEGLDNTQLQLGLTEVEKGLEDIQAMPMANIEEPERTTGQMTKSALDLVKEFEGFEPEAYEDAVGVKTVGYGTAATSGRDIPENVTEEEASMMANEDLSSIDRQLDDLIEVDITPNQREALKSLAYNVGIGAVARSQGLKKLNAGDVEGAAEEFFDEEKGFTKAGGKKLAGLVRRRAAERDVFMA